MKIKDLVQDIIHFWKAEEDDAPGASLEQADLPSSPVGAVTLSEEELDHIFGGTWDNCTLQPPTEKLRE